MKKITLLFFVLCAFTLSVNAQISVSSSPDLAITDDTPAGVDDVITVGATTGSVTDVTIDLEIYHTWMGDLIATLTAPDGTTSTIIMDRPGYTGSGFGCSMNNMNATLSDAGASSVEDECETSAWVEGDAGSPTYAIEGTFTAHDGIATVDLSSFFDGVDATGDWTLNVSDNAGGDTGKIVSWGLTITGPTLGLEDNSLQSFTYSPNPVKNTLNLKAAKNIDMVSVYNLLGQEVMRTRPNAVANDLDMSSLQSGAYFVKVSVEGVSKTVRIIKQ